MRASTFMLLAATAIIVDTTRVAIRSARVRSDLDISSNFTTTPGNFTEYDDDEFPVINDGPFGSWKYTLASEEQIKEVYGEEDGAYTVWDFGCFRLIVWNRTPRLQSMFLDCDLCRPEESQCSYKMWDTVLTALGYPLQAIAQFGHNLRCTGYEGFTKFCNWYCVPDASRDTCKQQELPRNLLREALQPISRLSEDVPELQPPQHPLQPALQPLGKRFSKNAWPPESTRQSGARPARIVPGSILTSSNDSDEALWIAQRQLPEGWVVRKVGSEEETVLPEMQLEAAPLDNEEVLAVRQRQIEALTQCRSACSEHEGEGKQNDHDGCCWTYAAFLDKELGSFASASCVAICTGRKKEGAAMEELLPSWVKIGA